MNPRRPMRRAKFSLRTMLLLLLTAGSFMTLWRHRDVIYLAAKLEGHSEKIISCDLSSDGACAVTGSLDNTARLWDLESGKELLKLDCEDDVYFVALSADKKVLVTASMNTVVRVWSLSDRKVLLTLSGYQDLAIPALSADGKLLAVPFKEGLKVVDARTGELKLTCNNSANLASCLFSPDGKYLAAASESGALVVFDTSRGTILPAVSGNGYPIAFSAQQLLTQTNSGVVHVFGTEDWRQSIQIGTGKYYVEAQIARAALTDESKVYTLSWDGYLSSWSADDGHKIERLASDAISDRLLRVTKDGKFLLTTGESSEMRVWRWRRPEGRWGLLWLPELWLTLVTTLAMLVSFLSDRRLFRSIPFQNS